MGYIQQAIERVKLMKLKDARKMQTSGTKTLAFRLQRMAPKKTGMRNLFQKDSPVTATIPITWIVDSLEKWEGEGSKEDLAIISFDDFVSDWIEGWG